MEENQKGLLIVAAVAIVAIAALVFPVPGISGSQTVEVYREGNLQCYKVQGPNGYQIECDQEIKEPSLGFATGAQIFEQYNPYAGGGNECTRVVNPFDNSASLCYTNCAGADLICESELGTTFKNRKPGKCEYHDFWDEDAGMQVQKRVCWT